jgi:hypothetical protein
MSTEYLIPENFLKEIETFLTKDEKSISAKKFKKYATSEFKRWLDERNIPLPFLFHVQKNHLTKITIPNCPVCGKELSFNQIIENRRFCSRKCSASSKELKEKRKQTNLKRYGTESIFQSDNFKEKTKRTCEEKYGVEYASQAKTIKEKKKETCLEKYGVEYSLQSNTVREKIKQTCLEKYGTEYASQSEIVKTKVKKTNLEKFGVEQSFQAKEVREKSKHTILEKYGTKHISQSETIKEKHRSKFWNTFCSNLKERNIVPLFSEKEYVNDTGRKFKCLICGKEFVSEGTCDYKKYHKNQNGTYTKLQTKHIFCPHCFKAPISKKEKEVLEFVKLIYHGEVVENDRKILEGKELDIFVPSLNLAIEFDGKYWHSLESIKEKDERKNQLCEEKGIKLLRIKEEDWNTNREEVEKRIKNFLAIK